MRLNHASSRPDSASFVRDLFPRRFLRLLWRAACVLFRLLLRVYTSNHEKREKRGAGSTEHFSDLPLLKVLFFMGCFWFVFFSDQFIGRH